VIGRDAEQKWKTIEEREKVKDVAIKDAEKQGLRIESKDQLVRKVEGDLGYRPVTEPERKIINQNREAAFAIGQMAKAKKEESKP